MGQDAADDADQAHEAELVERERRARQGPADPTQLNELAQEWDALADERDDAADGREAAALHRRERAVDRDVAATGRDRRSRVPHDDGDPGFRDRFLSGRDVDAAAGDRADALGDERQSRLDRGQAREARHRAASDRVAASRAAEDATNEAGALRRGLLHRAEIGQAQGLLMARFDISADEAFGLLVRESQTRNVKLREVAASVVQGDLVIRKTT